MNNTYSDIEFNTYTYTDNKKSLISFRYAFLITISLIIVSIGTCWLYNFINTDNTRIITYDMLLAVKNYNFDLHLMYKRTIIVRLIQIVGLIILSLSKWKNILKWMLPMAVAVKMAFILTIFIIEMHMYGLINYVIISFPHEICYITAIAYLIKKIYSDNDLSNSNKEFFRNRIRKMYYIKIMLLWICGILCETTINLVLVQKCLMIPRFYVG